MRKALGRCKLKHPKVVEYDPRERPVGECDKCVPPQPLIEWAIKLPAKPL